LEQAAPLGVRVPDASPVTDLHDTCLPGETAYEGPRIAGLAIAEVDHARNEKEQQSENAGDDYADRDTAMQQRRQLKVIQAPLRACACIGPDEKAVA
jgi:hypothetical protein